MTVVYIDSVFFLNTLMDYLLVLSAGRLAGIPLRRGRYLLAALAGGAYAAAVFLPGLGFLAAGPVKLAAGVLLSLIAFGGEAHFFRLTLLLFSVSCAMAGCVLALGLVTGNQVPAERGIFYTDISAGILLAAAGGAYLVLAVVFRAAVKHGLQGELVPVRACVSGKTAGLTALLDTGSGLREPSNGRPVLVTAPGALDGLLSREARAVLTPEGLASPADLLEPLRQIAPELRPRLLPYQAVGTAQGLLLAIRMDWAEIAGERCPGLTAALSPTALGNGYTALWGGEIGKGGRHETVTGTPLAAAGAAGPGRDGGTPLHWRQRHAATASDTGAGRGTAGTAGGRRGPERVD